MNKKKTIALISGGVLLIAIVAIILTTYLTNSYSKYATAYKNLFKSGSVDVKFDTVTNIDGKDYKASGDMKIKQNDKGQMMFMLSATANDIKLTQFTDGKYIYNDVNGVKTKINIGEKSKVLQPEQNKNQKFDMNLYQQRLSSFLEAGKIKDLKLLDLIDSKYIKKIESKSTNSGKQYNLTFSDELTSSLVQVFSEEQANSSDTKAKISVKELKCTIDENSSGVVSGANYIIAFDTTIPAKLTGEAKDKTIPVKTNIKMTFVNPGSPVNITFPSTDGYK